MTADARDFVQHCEICQKNKRDFNQKHGWLIPLPTPTEPWDVVGIDFVTGLPKTKQGHDAILVVVDHLTKMTHAIPCTKTITAKETAKLFVENIFRYHGMSQAIVSDRGPQFISQFWHSLFTQLGTQLMLSTAYHPQTNGLTERVNGILMGTLRIFCSQHAEMLDEWLIFAEFAYNNSVHSATKQTPFYLNSGKEPRVPLSLINTLKMRLNLQNPMASRDFARLHRHLQDAQDAVKAASCRPIRRQGHQTRASTSETCTLLRAGVPLKVAQSRPLDSQQADWSCHGGRPCVVSQFRNSTARTTRLYVICMGTLFSTNRKRNNMFAGSSFLLSRLRLFVVVVGASPNLGITIGSSISLVTRRNRRSNCGMVKRHINWNATGSGSYTVKR